ncbi:MAG: thiamine phosphate synthase [Candidatus Omnitrophica bacterium]|nr:thiamine phosphate synthase [Candidatus Omnitrophota bacterium]
MKKIISKGFYFITDSLLSKKGNIEDVKSALAAGVSAIQYRNKTNNITAMIREAGEIKKLCDKTPCPFIVNDALDVALAVDADGFHIGRDDIAYSQARMALGNDKIIGVSVSTFEEALIAKEWGADYLGLGPIFQTTTKLDSAKPCGVELIREIRKVCRLPLIAIGGITLEHAKEVVAAGADGLCAISAVVSRDNVVKEIEKFNKFFEKHF